MPTTPDRAQGREKLGRGGVARTVVWAVALLAVVASVLLTRTNEAFGATQLTRPNIILILSDDQSYESIYKMPFLRSRIPPQGGWYRFNNAFINNATCCPSRATILTGLWSHHHGVEATGGAVPFDDSDTIATRLHAAGYRTGFVGKYHLSTVNGGGGPTYIPPGWDAWQAFANNTPGWYYDYTLNQNGTLVDYGSAPADYSTDVLRRKARIFINQSAWSGRPFFMVYAPRGPHNNWIAAPRDVGHYATEPVKFPPSWNEDTSDKPAWWAGQPRATASYRTGPMRMEWDTLLSVDDAVEAIYKRVRNLGLMSNTVIVYMTDNGYAFGEHRYTGKVCAYEECSHTPLLVKYGRHGEGWTFPKLVGNEDLAPTFARLAGVSPPQPSDGQSFAPMLQAGTSPPNWENAILLHGYDAGENDGDNPPGHPPTFWGLRTPRYKYIETVRTGEVELYDLAADPHELNNVAKRPKYAGVRAQRADRLHRLALRGTTAAGKVSVDPAGRLIFDAGPGAKNVVTVGARGGSWLPTDLSKPIAAGAGCEQIRVARISCPQADVSRVVLKGEDKIDILDGPDGIGAVLVGGADDDRLTAGNRRDHVAGGDGKDTLEGGPGRDRMFAGRGNDTIRASGDGAADEIDCGDGTDVVYADPRDVYPTTGPGACEIVR